MVEDWIDTEAEAARVLRELRRDLRKLRRRVAVLVIATIAANTVTMLTLWTSGGTRGRATIGWALVAALSAVAVWWIARLRNRMSALDRAILVVRELR
jgi:hypothetical protein